MLKPMEIDTLDALVPEPLVAELFETLSAPSYRFGGQSNPGDMFGFWMASINSEILSAVPAFSKFWALLERHVLGDRFEAYQMIVNATNFGDCPTVHTDIDADKYVDHHTALYFGNAEWHWDWAGETVFMNDARDEIIRSVYPRPGRLCTFDSRIPHVSRTPTRVCPVVRYTIAVKLRPAGSAAA